MLLSVVIERSGKEKVIKTVELSVLLSGSIGFLQLIFKFGFAEFDDVFDNTLGAVLGAVLVLIFSEVRKKR